MNLIKKIGYFFSQFKLKIFGERTIQDVTARKEAEEQLNREKERLQSLSDNLPNGVLFQFFRNINTGKMGFSFLSSDKFVEKMKISIEKALDDTEYVFSMVHPDDLPMIIETIEQSALKLTDHDIKFRFGPFNRWVHLVSRPRRESDQIIWDGILMDITEQKELENELKLEKNRLQTMNDNVPGSSLFQFVRHIKTGQLRLSYLSSTWEKVTGITADPAMLNISELYSGIHPEDLVVFNQSVAQSAETMSDLTIEFRCRERWLKIVARPRCERILSVWGVENPQKDLKEFLQNTNLIVWDGIISDITKRKEMEINLKEERNRFQLLSDSMLETFSTRENEWIRALDNMDDGTLFRSVRDIETGLFCFDYVSKTWEKITGVSAKDTLLDSGNIFKHIPQSDWDTLKQNIYESDVEKTKFNATVRYVHPIGNKTCYFQILSYSRLDANKVI